MPNTFSALWLAQRRGTAFEVYCLKVIQKESEHNTAIAAFSLQQEASMLNLVGTFSAGTSTASMCTRPETLSSRGPDPQPSKCHPTLCARLRPRR